MKVTYPSTLKRNIYALLSVIITLPVMVNSTYALRTPYYEIERPRLSLSFYYELENDERTGKFRQTKNTSQTFRETLEIETEGWLVYPRLMTYSFRLSPQWEQFDQDTDSSFPIESNETLLGYTARVTLLPVKPYTLDLLASRTRSSFSTTFADRSVIESDLYGAGLTLKYRILPTQINYRYQENKQVGFFNSTGDSEKISLVMSYDRHLGSSRLNAEYTDVSTTFLNSANRNKFLSTTFRNTYEFTRNIYLSSRYSYNETKNDTSTTETHKVNEFLTWKHRENLRTNYTFNYNNSELDTGKSESLGGGFDLSALLTDTLSVSISANGSSNSSPSIDELFYGGGIGFIYNKPLDWGRLNVSTRHNYSVNNRDVKAEFSQVRDEELILAAGPGVLLDRSGIVVDSIVITDTTGTIFYKKDIHYRVRTIGESVEISRIAVVTDPVPAIGEGDTVLVDYDFRNRDTFDFSLFNQTYNASLQVKSSWRIYYSFNRSTQTVISGTATEDPPDDIVHNAGAELYWRITRTVIDYQKRDVSEIPSQVIKFRETIAANPRFYLYYSLSAGYSRIHFEDSDRSDEYYDLRPYVQWIPKRDVTVNMEGYYLWSRGDVTDSVEKGITLLLQYVRGIWTGSLKYRYKNLKDNKADDTSVNNTVVFELKRSMF